MKFQETKQYKKGSYGMKIVDDFLVNKGYIPYSPDNIDKAHPFDRLVAKDNKKEIFIAEGKTKPSRLYYKDTGIDIKNYNEYQFIFEKYKLQIFLFFVDEDKKEIYGNWLDKLDEEKFEFGKRGGIIKYPLKQNGIIYFPLSSMEPIHKLTNEQAEKIKKYSTKSEKYKRNF